MPPKRKAAKKLKASKADAKSDVKSAAADLGLPFGSNRRVLPWQVESFVYTWLDLDDLGALFWANKLLSSQVTRFLAKAKTLHIKLKEQHTDEQKHMPSLMLRHCRSLQSFAVKGYCSERWLNRLWPCLIDNNRNSIRRIRLSNCDEHYVVAALVKCPNLEALQISDDTLPDELVSAISVTDLPHLRSLGLEWTHSRQQMKILSQSTLAFRFLVWYQLFLLLQHMRIWPSSLSSRAHWT